MLSIKFRTYTTFLQGSVTLVMLNKFNIKPVDFNQETKMCQVNKTTEKKKIYPLEPPN